jgi:hypothetical protein
MWLISAVFLGLVASDLPSYFKHQNDYNYKSLGASGRICICLHHYFSLECLYGALKVPQPAVLYIVCACIWSSRNANNVTDAHLWGLSIRVETYLQLASCDDAAIVRLSLRSLKAQLIRRV